MKYIFLFVVGFSFLAFSDDLEKLSNGRVFTELQEVSNSRYKKALTQGVVFAPTNEVWMVLNDFNNYSEFFPGFKKSKLLSTSENQTLFYSYMSMPWPVSDIEYNSEVSIDTSKQYMAFELQKGTGKGVKSFKGSWKLSPFNTYYTLAKYEVTFQPDRQYPGWMMNLGAKFTVGKHIKAIRDRVTFCQKNQCYAKPSLQRN